MVAPFRGAKFELLVGVRIMSAVLCKVHLEGSGCWLWICFAKRLSLKPLTHTACCKKVGSSVCEGKYV